MKLPRVPTWDELFQSVHKVVQGLPSGLCELGPFHFLISDDARDGRCPIYSGLVWAILQMMLENGSGINLGRIVVKIRGPLGEGVYTIPPQGKEPSLISGGLILGGGNPVGAAQLARWRDAVFGQGSRMAFYHFLAIFPALLLLLTLTARLPDKGVQLKIRRSSLSERNGSADLYRVKPDGAGLTQLTSDPAYDDQAAFGGRIDFELETAYAPESLFLRNVL